MYFNNSYGPLFGYDTNLGINNNKLRSSINNDPFRVPANSGEMHEITEEPPGDRDYKDYEVFAISRE